MLAVLIAVIVILLGGGWWLWSGEAEPRAQMQSILFKGLLGWLLCYTVALVIWQVVHRGVWTLVRRAHAPVLPVAPSDNHDPVETVEHLRNQYGYFWRRKVRLFLWMGEPEQIEATVPTLTTHGWLEAEGVVMLWGGSLQSALNMALIKRWAPLYQRRGFDGVIWAIDPAMGSVAPETKACIRRLQDMGNALGWQVPLHLWQVCVSEWPQHNRKAQPVGCLLGGRSSTADLQICLDKLQQPLREQGLAQVQNTLSHDFLLRLSQSLRAEGTDRWRSILLALQGKQCVSLQGLWFGLPVVHREAQASEHFLSLDTAWAGLLTDSNAKPRRLGWRVGRLSYVAAVACAALWGVGLLLSFISNRAEVARVDEALAALQQATGGSDSLGALDKLVRDLSRLDYRAEHGAPWYQRFGLDQAQPLRNALWPHYTQANNQLLRDPAAATLKSQLTALLKLNPSSPQRAERAKQAYDQLKAYLMLARPEKADAAFLVRTLGAAEPTLWTFFAEQLPANPDWAIQADARLIAQVRQVLLGQLGQRNADTSLYQRALDAAANHYPAQGLEQLVGDTDASTLFDTAASVPGVFTRQAWEGHVRQAIDEAANARREQIDWVLSDNPQTLAAELSPDQLRERLTARYFQDYGSAWLAFLNSLRWQQRGSLDEVIAQLTLMSDARQSPLIALMNTLAYQAQAGMRGQALADSLIQSAQNLIGQDKPALIEQLPQGQSGPLDSTFGPLLTLLGKKPEGQLRDDSLSLQAFLTRVTSTRLKLQQVTQAPDPQAMTQALAQTVFQGKRVDLTETQAYGSLIAASLGAEWGGAAQALFVQPLDQAWQRVLQPSAAGLNRNWQRAVVDEWNGAFAGRYPFAVTSSDASLPMLGQMIRADSGRIEQFLREQLSGLLRKEGSRWVADPRYSQGLRFNPQFLAAINQLSQLADVLYTDGGMGLSFELRGKPVRDVVQTTFILNGEKHHYFNQRERWQRFRWPGQSDYPGVSLSWASVHTGERLFADLQGTWGLIRLLEQAQVTHLDDGGSQMRVVLKAPDGLGLTWHLRTELAGGPLALLALRGFTLPREIFLVGDANVQRVALRGEAQ
uniref:ImcF-related family protein n=1 Tax=Pseudomonas faucium TaxID=2740518 RepID=UPI00353170CC